MFIRPVVASDISLSRVQLAQTYRPNFPFGDWLVREAPPTPILLSHWPLFVNKPLLAGRTRHTTAVESRLSRDSRVGISTAVRTHVCAFDIDEAPQQLGSYGLDRAARDIEIRRNMQANLEKKTAAVQSLAALCLLYILYFSSVPI